MSWCGFASYRRISRWESAPKGDVARTWNTGFVYEVRQDGIEQAVHLHGEIPFLASVHAGSSARVPSSGLFRILPFSSHPPQNALHGRVMFVTGIPLSTVPILDTARDLGKMKNTNVLGAAAPQPITDLPEHENVHIGYNVTHDAGLIAMGFATGKTSEKHGWIDPPAHRIGVDVMRLSVPDRFTFQAFVETVGDAVRTIHYHLPPSTPSSSLPRSVTPFFRNCRKWT